MNVTVSVGGKFHAFDLAKQLLEKDSLTKLMTSYPTYKASRFGIPRGKVTSVIAKEVLERGWRYVPSVLRNSHNPQFVIHEIYDYLASYALPKSDLLHVWSSFGLHTIRKAKRQGMKVVVARGSAHIEYQRELLREESSRWGIVMELPHPGIIEKELQEYQEADLIDVPSAFARNSFIAKGVSPHKIVQIPYGADLTRFRPLPKEDQVFRVIHCGAISIQKGVHYLLQAFHELRLPNAELWLVGRLTPGIEPFLKRYQSDQIILKGRFSHDNLSTVYSQGSIFCLASIQEGMAKVILEAMACGLPVVATENTGGGDVVRDGQDGFIIPIRDVEAIQDRILQLYRDPGLRRAMGQSALHRVKNAFTWRDYGEAMVAAYNGLA